MSSATLIDILETLGGPKVTSEDVDWIADLPTGRDLLNFLSLQIGDRVALREIGLEIEESDLWNRAIRAKLVTENLPSFTPIVGTELPQTPLDYVSPSALRSQLGDIEEEQALLDHQLQALDRRIALERRAVDIQKRTQKSITAAHSQTSLSVLQLEEQLSELSVHADLTVSSAVRRVSQLVNRFSGTNGEDCHHAYQHITELSNLLEIFSRVSFDLSQMSSAHFQTEPNDSGSLRAETQRLASSIQELEEKHIDIAWEKECQSLEKSLSKIEDGREPGVPRSRFFETVIEQAWCKEQSVALQQRIKYFDQITNLLQDKLLPPLALIHSSLSMSEASVDHTHVTLHALVDELDDIVADLNPLEDVSVILEQSQVRETFNERAKTILKQMRHLRPTDLPALVLADHEDVVSELSGVRARYDRVNEDITALCSNISSDLKSFNEHPRMYLAALTVHSPMPATSPLMPPPRVQHQRSRAREQIDAAANALATMPDDLTKNNRVRRKLDAFVEAHGRA